MSSTHAVVVAETQVEAVGDLCPWCEQAIPHDVFQEIQGRIQEKERRRSEEQAGQLRATFDKARAEANAKAQERNEKIERDHQVQIEQLKTAAAEQERQAREKASKKTEATFTARVRLAERDKSAAEKKLVAADAKHDKEVAARVQEARTALDKEHGKTLHARERDFLAERKRYEEKVDSLKRQLEKKTSGELGDGAEIDLYDALNEAFPDDTITRVKKGTPGADILHDVVEDGSIRGRIVYESKNRRSWRKDYVEKLRDDQHAAKADHAVLATMKFPKGHEQLHRLNGVIIADPARVTTIAALLRDNIIHAHRLDLGQREREAKTARLYEFISSESCSQLFDHFETLCQELLKLDVDEKRAHDSMWTKRGTRIRKAQKLMLGDLQTRMNRIIEGENVNA